MRLWLSCLLAALTARGAVVAQDGREGTLPPAIAELRKNYQEERERLAKARTAELQALLSRHLDEARTLLAEKKRAGNLSGVGLATRSIELLESFLKELGEKGDFVVPEEGRRELTALRETIAREKRAIDERHTTALAQVEARYRDQVAVQLRATRGQEISADEIADFFRPVVRTNVVAATPAPEATVSSPAEETLPEGGEKPALTSPGSATNWVTIARWFASVSSVEMVEVPLLDRREPQQASVPASPVGHPYETRYEPVRVLPSGEGYRFRLAPLPRHEMPEVEAWPSRANSWTLLLRVRPHRDVPSRHGIEIQVAGPGAEALPLAAAASEATEPETASDRPPVQIRITSHPDGAVVMVDGSPLRRGNDYVRTPCVVPLTPGSHQIRLRKFGYLDGVVPSFQAAEGATLHWTFQKDPATADVTVQIPARGPLRNTGVTVKPGDRLLITAEGKWRCGKGREDVDAEGYPNDATFYKYYLNPKDSPRLLPGANYGALILRIGKDGPLCKVGKIYRGTAAAEGALFLGINEAEEAHADNGGSLTVRIRKAPGESSGP